MSSTLPATSTTFEERLKDRIRESIGELLSDEDLAKLVEKATNEVFFKPKKIADPRDRYREIDGPSLLHGIVKDLLQDTVKTQVREYIQAHQAEVTATVQQVLEQGMGLCMLAAVRSMFSADLSSFAYNLEQKLKNGTL